MDTASAQVIKLSREELYEQIWNVPTIKLARSYGLSEVAFGKICKKHVIPKPPLGYWAKLAHGKHVARPALPALADNHLEVIEIKKRPLACIIPMPRSDESAKESPITVPDRLTSPHSLVKRTIEALKNATPDDCGILRS